MTEMEKMGARAKNAASVLAVAGKKKKLIKSRKKKNNGWYCFCHRNLQPFRKPDLKRV